jgi:hypothetical protein
MRLGSPCPGIGRGTSREGLFVLVPDPKVVRRLLTRYATLRIAEAERGNPATTVELGDVSYTLCVMMGTTDIQDAIAKADALLLDAGRAKAAAREPAAPRRLLTVSDLLDTLTEGSDVRGPGALPPVERRAVGLRTGADHPAEPLTESGR